MAEISVFELCDATTHDDPDIVDYITKFNQEQNTINLNFKNDNESYDRNDISNETDENTYEPLLPPLKLDENEEEDDTDKEFASIQASPPKRIYKKRKKNLDKNSVFEFKEENKEFPGILNCKKCEYKTTKKHLLSRHIIMHQTERPYQCTFCEKRFKVSVALENHKNKHLGIKKRRCTECDQCFTTSSELIRHIRYKHTLERPFRCTICTYSSVEKAKLTRHIRSHTGERPFPCPHCSYRSADMFKLKRHIRVHTGEKPYKCDVCSMCFSQQNSMKSHRILHFERPVFQCELCPSTLTREADLRDHVRRIHTSTVPILCGKCGKSFPDRYTFKIHTRTHQGQMCFKCELCSFQTNYMQRLEAHMCKHTGDRPYLCRFCNENFKDSGRLNTHLLNEHHVNKHNKLILKCNYCEKLFVSHGCFKKHLKKFHRDYLENSDDLEDSVVVNNSIVANIVTTNSGKKKRGRPKKLKLNNGDDSSFISDSNLNTSLNTSIRRKRGRPRKNIEKLIQNIKQESDSTNDISYDHSTNCQTQSEDQSSNTNMLLENLQVNNNAVANNLMDNNLFFEMNFIDTNISSNLQDEILINNLDNPSIMQQLDCHSNDNNKKLSEKYNFYNTHSRKTSLNNTNDELIDSSKVISNSNDALKIVQNDDNLFTKKIMSVTETNCNIGESIRPLNHDASLNIPEYPVNDNYNLNKNGCIVQFVNSNNVLLQENQRNNLNSLQNEDNCSFNLEESMGPIKNIICSTEHSNYKSNQSISKKCDMENNIQAEEYIICTNGDHVTV